jgi:magnesium chelatase subunit D
LVSTLFEAAKFQFIRQQNSEASTDRILITPSDLRGYRRAPVPEQLLVLLLDYTCLAGRRWLESLLPFFKQAYIGRARICLIQVGAATAGHPLRADRQFFNNVLVPGLAAALEAPAGKATPLAHGLELALQTLRHALQHGRQIAHSARLVVISDGRGNVPLTASITGRIENPVGREGIEDALHTAHKLRALDRVEISFLDPQPSSHAGLVSDLADGLGAVTQEIPLLEMEWLEA